MPGFIFQQQQQQKEHEIQILTPQSKTLDTLQLSWSPVLIFNICWAWLSDSQKEEIKSRGCSALLNAEGEASAFLRNKLLHVLLSEC